MYKGIYARTYGEVGICVDSLGYRRFRCLRVDVMLQGSGV